MADEIKDTIEQVAKDGIRRARGDQGEVEMMSVSDLIAADRHIANKAASSNPATKIKRARLSPPGGTGT